MSFSMNFAKASSWPGGFSELQEMTFWVSLIRRCLLIIQSYLVKREAHHVSRFTNDVSRFPFLLQKLLRLHRPELPRVVFIINDMQAGPLGVDLLQFREMAADIAEGDVFNFRVTLGAGRLLQFQVHGLARRTLGRQV